MRIEDRVACATCKAHRDRTRTVMCAVCHDLECVPVLPTRGDLERLQHAAQSLDDNVRVLEARQYLERIAAAGPLEEPRH